MKRIIAILIATNVFTLSYGQSTFKFPANLNTGAELIELAMSETVILLEQDYALQDASGQRFGREGQPRFNSVPFIGIQTTEGIVFQEDISKPWLYDADFQLYQESYTPCLSETRMSVINTAKQDTVSISDSLVYAVEDKYFILQDSTYNCGLVINTKREPSSNGWFVWITQKKDEDNIIGFNAFKREFPQPDEQGCVSIKQPNVQEIILGGFYVVPFNNGPGTLGFYLDAVFVRNKTDIQKWDISRIVEPAVIIKDSAGLTPIDNLLENEK